jgi:hypothetical protein
MALFDIPSGVGVAAISVHPVDPVWLALGCLDGVVRVYDRRCIKPPGWGWGDEGRSTRSGSTNERSGQVKRGEVYAFRPKNFGHGDNDDDDNEEKEEASTGSSDTATDGLEGWGVDATTQHRRRSRRRIRSHHKITSLKFDPMTGNELLVSYSGENVYLIRPNAGDGLEPAVFKTTQIGKRKRMEWDTLRAKMSEVGKDSDDDGDPELDNAEDESINCSSIWDSLKLNPDNRDADIVKFYTGHQNTRTMVCATIS